MQDVGQLHKLGSSTVSLPVCKGVGGCRVHRGAAWHPNQTGGFGGPGVWTIEEKHEICEARNDDWQTG